jgi:MarR family transcriptional regulator, organic hydroperoxide resistance regulator
MNARMMPGCLRLWAISLYVYHMRATASTHQRSPRPRQRPIPSDIELAAWVRLAHAYHRILRRLETALDEHKITLAQFEVLAHLHYDSGIVQTDLARRLLVTKGNVCGLIDRLTAAKLVMRQPAVDDRRANRLFLTARGRQMIAKTLPVHLGLIKELMGTLPPGDLRRLQDLLGRLESAVGEPAAD